MWESPIYRFEVESTNKNGKIIKKACHINVTYSAPRNLKDPGKALIGIFSRMTQGYDPEKTNILDIGAAKLRNTLWLLQKGFNVWAVEFPELKERLPDAEAKWSEAEGYRNFHKITFPKDFINLQQKFDFILLINIVNVMPIPLERFALLSLCRDRISDSGMLLWHNWRGESIGGPERYSEDNAFIDGHLGGGPHYTFYTEFNREVTHEILYSLGFSYNSKINLGKIPSNTSAYSYLFNPTHDSLIGNTLDVGRMIKTSLDSKNVIPIPETTTVLELYTKELQLVLVGDRNAKQRNADAKKYHLLSSRIFFEVFRNQLCEPKIEQEINEGLGRIDIVYRNKNKEGIFRDLKELRDIPCPDVMVECKNYKNDLTNDEYNQLADRLIPERGMLGFLLCRDKCNQETVLKHCRSRHKGGARRFIIVLDDKDLTQLASFKLNDEDDTNINNFINDKVKEIID
jgi:hypothetical protein